MRNVIVIKLFLPVTIYSCSKMAQGDCSLCKNFEEAEQELNCRWCDSPLSCEYRSHCKADRLVTMCPPPEVEQVKYSFTSLCFYQGHQQQYIKIFLSFLSFLALRVFHLLIHLILHCNILMYLRNFQDLYIFMSRIKKFS